jgi:hypothetical protein
MNIYNQSYKIADSILNGQFEQAKDQAKGISYKRLFSSLLDNGASFEEAKNICDKVKGR